MEKQAVVPETIDQYIAGFPPETQKILQEVRRVISLAAPQAQEKISYQMPTFYLKKNLVHFAAFKNHLGFYPTPSGTEKFTSELAEYKTSKGAIQFPWSKPIPYDLIRRITEYRVEEVTG